MQPHTQSSHLAWSSLSHSVRIRPLMQKKKCSRPRGATKCVYVQCFNGPIALVAIFSVRAIRTDLRSGHHSVFRPQLALKSTRAIRRRFSFVHHSKMFFLTGCKLTEWKVSLNGWPSAFEWNSCSKKRMYCLHGIGVRWHVWCGKKWEDAMRHNLNS